MADLAEATTHIALPRRDRFVVTLFAGLAGGALLGVAARAWMRLISDDPEFTWSGTLFIVIGFTVFGLTQAIVAVVRRRATRRWPVKMARTIGAIGMLPLFVAAGAIMFPTVVGAGLARWRDDWRRPFRVLLALVACGPIVFVGSGLVDSFGWSLQTVAGFSVMLAVYGAIVSATRFTLTRAEGARRLPGWVRVVLVVLVCILVVLPMVGAG